MSFRLLLVTADKLPLLLHDLRKASNHEEVEAVYQQLLKLQQMNLSYF